MITTTVYGYLEAAYMLAPYLSDFATASFGTQIDRRIEAFFTNRTQIERRIDSGTRAQNTQLDRRIDTGISAIRTNLDQRVTSDQEVRTQLDRRIDSGLRSINAQIDRRSAGNLTPTRQQIEQRITSEESVRSQLDRRVEETSATGFQIDREITDDSAIRSQLDRKIADDQAVRSQVEARITSDSRIRSEIDRRIDTGLKLTRMELSRGPVSHQLCNGYLQDAYLMVPYLSPLMCAHLRQQISLRIADTAEVRTQLDRRIETTKRTRTQIEHRITSSTALRTQLLRQAAYKLNTQILFSIYNTTNIRILWEFPSRGTSGTNWSVIAGGTTAGDFGINNVNTDIVEQQYRSVNTSVTIQCDTQVSQGIFNDTVGILGHNFSISATVTMQGTNDPTFSSVPFSEALPVELENIYWVSEYLPLSSYRYWRFIITDPTNADGLLKIGTIVFGSSLIFNGECFIDEVVRRKTHFADRIRTEAFSSVSNDRALKRAVSLSFRRLDFNRDNYENLVQVIDTIRTSLKALWIPTPRYASRFAVFAKLAEMPVENHKAISQTADYIDLDLNMDEAL